ncbi:MAG: sigma-70 family RNA polymerase sigma factor [Myxococcota bacterium]
MSDSDRALLVAWSEGDAAAGETLVRRHVGPVYGFFRNKLDGEVDDIVQRTFLGCIEALPRFRAEASFRTFVFAVARNMLLMELRRRYRAPKTVDAATESTFDLGTTTEPALPGNIEGYREQVLLLRALRRLPVDDQVALELFYWENMPSKEIAVVLDRPHATVRTQLRRARHRLDALIEELGHDARLVTSTTDAFDQWVAHVREAMAAS